MGHEIFKGKSKSMGGVLCGIDVNIGKSLPRYEKKEITQGMMT